MLAMLEVLVGVVDIVMYQELHRAALVIRHLHRQARATMVGLVELVPPAAVVVQAL
jgi:hypothetical protein